MDRDPRTTSEKNWWTPVWRGLVVHPEGKHVQQMSKALGLYLYLLAHADRRSGRLVRKYGTIARDMGFPVRTIRTWMARLAFYDYVGITKTGHAMVIDIPKWRPIGPDPATLRGKISPVRVAEIGQVRAGASSGTQQRRAENEPTSTPNESTLTRDIKRERIVKKFSDSDPEFGTPQPTSRLELLAQDLAVGLDDPDQFPRYRRYAHRFPEPLLRRLLSEARATPVSEIKRSRAALFEYLLHQHDASTPSATAEDPRR
jgi:hypothetical protein